MYKKILLLLFIVLLIAINSKAQQLKGKITEISADGKESVVINATLQWLGTDIETFSDLDGNYVIYKNKKSSLLIVKYLSYVPDTINVKKDQFELNIILSGYSKLKAVEIAAKQGAYISIQPILTTFITTEGLRKAACCNLSESFDATVAVDVEYSDAVTGAKQISMLGLSGIYSQILLENVPFIRLLSNQFGLSYVPGTWMTGISISKGISSVTNGFEAIAGQIDIEYKKPETNKEKLFVNAYVNSMAKGEVNFNSRIKIKDHVSTMFLLHGEGQFVKWDMNAGNKDNFIDIPINYQINGMNRWDYSVPGKFEGRTLVSYLWEDRFGGQLDYDFNKKPSENSGKWGFRIKNNRLNLISKNGILLPDEFESIGTIVAFTFHDNNSFFGFRNWHAQQVSGYVNLMYSNKYGKLNRHKIIIGTSLQVDFLKDISFTEKIPASDFEDSYFILSTDKEKLEIVPGTFIEYSYSVEDKFIIMPGFRFDYNFFYKMPFITPRIHLKWLPYKSGTVRFSAGRGYRTANVIAENMSMLISNKKIVYSEKLAPEDAINTGVSFVQTFNIKGRKSSITLDYYYTHFLNQTILDLDKIYNNILITNLHDKSYSHSFQAELMIYPLPQFEIIVAYRYNGVWMTTNDILQSKALSIPHKAVLNISYATKFDKWKFNTTLQFNGSARLPNSLQNQMLQLSERSNPYFILNTQITKKIGPKWEIYLGGENLLNVKQKNPIIDARNPYSENFDGSIIYAPITGAMAYVGFRLSIK